MSHRIEYSPDAESHLRALTARQQATVLDAVDMQLTHQPNVETRNRKPMHPNPIAPWELRVGNLRVYYEVHADLQRLVCIRAVGVKRRNRVWLGKEVIEL